MVLTFLFVMVISALIYPTSIAAFRQDYLETRLENAQIAALALEAAPGNMVSPELEERLLAQSGVIAIIMRRDDKSLLLGFNVMPEEVSATFDLRNPSLGMLIMDAFGTLEEGGNRAIRVLGDPMVPGTRMLEITLHESGLYQALRNYSNNVLVLSLITSLFTGILVYLALHWMLVRPMRRLKDRIVTFRQKPEAVQSPGRQNRRPDEIGLVERELVRMQDELRQNLKQKSNLAALGEAVAKINHDLRNILATAQLASDSLQRVDHPGVQKVTRRLVNSVSRAVALCESTIRHGKADDPIPEKKWVVLGDLVTEVAVSLGLDEDDQFTFNCKMDADLAVYVDEEQFHRVLLNLCRNAREVQGEAGEICVSASRDPDGTVHIKVSDKGPGIPEAIRPTLFKAFQSSRAGGTGLGLATARDIVLAHGGQIGLAETSTDGTTFMICMPGEENSG
ncbi:MAG: HAMP domain-containing histidine kinase [Alphaproteobacteria bacterium]|nr:HAMP domain-containing histidine kinase [Alphaproteobacteria bacterium]